MFLRERLSGLSPHSIRAFCLQGSTGTSTSRSSAKETFKLVTFSPTSRDDSSRDFVDDASRPSSLVQGPWARLRRASGRHEEARGNLRRALEAP